LKKRKEKKKEERRKRVGKVGYEEGKVLSFLGKTFLRFLLPFFSFTTAEIQTMSLAVIGKSIILHS